MNLNYLIGVLIIFYGLIVIRNKSAWMRFGTHIDGIPAIIWGVFIIFTGLVLIYFISISKI